MAMENFRFLSVPSMEDSNNGGERESNVLFTVANGVETSFGHNKEKGGGSSRSV